MSTANATYQSKFLRTLQERGFIHQCTDATGLDSILSEGEKNNAPVAAYIGFDCTAPSLHVGSLLQIMALRWFQKSGHKPIVLMGGGTTRVGDPSGKDESRKMLDDDGINANLNGIRQVFDKYLSFGNGAADAMMVNNAEWLDKLNYIDFLRDYGRLFSINRMLSMDSVKLRLEREQHLSFLEFNYMILQAYDFVELNKRYGCRLQMGGSDQWGNIINGVELSRKVAERSLGLFEKLAYLNVYPKDKEESLASLFGLTTPLLTTSSGAKMGKTANGAVWLNADACSPYDFWQYWRNTSDADVARFLKLFSELPLEEIDALCAPSANINEAKKILATEITALAHGRAAAEQAAETARQTFEQGGAGESLPQVFLPGDVLRAGVPAFELFFQSGMAASKSEARKLIRGNGAKLDGQPITDENAMITLPADKPDMILSAGKKQHKRLIAQ